MRGIVQPNGPRKTDAAMHTFNSWELKLYERQGIGRKKKNQCAMCLFTLAFYVSTGCPVSIRFFTCYFFFLIFVANEISLENTKSTHLYCVFFLYSSRLTPLCNKPRKIAKLARLSTAWSLDHRLTFYLTTYKERCLFDSVTVSPHFVIAVCRVSFPILFSAGQTFCCAQFLAPAGSPSSI